MEKTENDNKVSIGFNNTEQEQLQKYLPPAIFLLKELADDNLNRGESSRKELKNSVRKLRRLRTDDRSSHKRKNEVWDDLPTTA